MHGHVDIEQFYANISTFLGPYYLALALMNGVAALYLWRSMGKAGQALIWIVVSGFFVILASIASAGSPAFMQAVSIPPAMRNLIDALTGPVVYSVGTVVLLAVLFVFRRFFVKPVVAGSMLNLSLLLMGLSMTDADFAAIVTKADNVPIVGLIFLLGYFTWLATYIAVQNDDRAKEGLPPLEKLDDEKVLVWPDLVYTELICMVAVTAFLIVWAILLQAPLEEPASSVKTPNPSKAPWYFLGLQEMLVYFDPWMAGVVAPSLVIVGLMAIPYLDYNKAGNGYYTIEQRPFAYLIFQFGFLVLWITLIILGTFLRGPNWNFFGPYETWDPHKVEVLNNVDLSQIFWVLMLDRGMPQAPDGSGGFVQLGYILLRELPGIILLVGYFAVLPPLLVVVSKYFRDMYKRMGFIRYIIMTFLLLMMAMLPIKMVLRWTLNLKYIVAIPEWILNF